MLSWIVFSNTAPVTGFSAGKFSCLFWWGSLITWYSSVYVCRNTHKNLDVHIIVHMLWMLELGHHIYPVKEILFCRISTSHLLTLSAGADLAKCKKRRKTVKDAFSIRISIFILIFGQLNMTICQWLFFNIHLIL